MDQLSTLLDFEGKKSFKKDIHSEEINVEIYLERTIKWLGLFSLALAVIAQLMNEVSGTDMKCFPDKNVGFGNGDWMKQQMDLSKAFGEYVDVHCATAMIDYGPLFPNDTAPAAKYSRDDVNKLAKNQLHLPYRRCIENHDDLDYCNCDAKWKDYGKKYKKNCTKPLVKKGTKQGGGAANNNGPGGKPGAQVPGTVPKSARQQLLDNEIKYREEMFHHYFAWFLLMQAIAILLPQHLWNVLFGDKILRKLLQIHDCTQASEEELKKQGKDLLTQLDSLENPPMLVFFLIRQVYFFALGSYGYYILYDWVGYGIQENQVTRCLMEEYTFVICASPANGSIWFVYVIDAVVIWVIVLSAFVNVLAILVKRFTKAHIKKEFLKKLLDKKFEKFPQILEKLGRLQNEPCSDYPMFSRICQENIHIFGDIVTKLMSRNEIVTEDDEETDYINVLKSSATSTVSEQ